MSERTYDLVKCGICGCPWTDHDPRCAGERYRVARMEEFKRLEDPRELAVIQVNAKGIGVKRTPTVRINDGPCIAILDPAQQTEKVQSTIEAYARGRSMPDWIRRVYQRCFGR